MADIMFALLFGAVSLLYATVSEAGGTAFLALMAFASFPSNEMRPTALLLNIVAATFSTWLFNRESLVDWVKLGPLLLASVPTALVGGFTALDERLYKTVTGLILLSAATILVLQQAHDTEPDRPTPFWGAISIGAVRIRAYRRRRRCVSRALTNRIAMGIPEADGRAFSAVHIGKFGRRACRRYVRWTDPRCRNMAIRACRHRRCYDRLNRRITLVVANCDALRSSRNFSCGRSSIIIFLATDFSNMIWVVDEENSAEQRERPVTLLPTLSIRIYLGTKSHIGPGKIQLLENIRTRGSISAAGRAMNMSYKRAWDLVDDIDRGCGRAAVQRQKGGKNGGGAMLTPFGLSLVARYRKIEQSVERAARKELLTLRSDMDARKKAGGRSADFH
jgi:molybdate transport system regulatory protein